MAKAAGATRANSSQAKPRTTGRRKPERSATSGIEAIADSILSQLKAGTAPFAKRWDTAPPIPPHNPVSGVQYKGVNTLHLASFGYNDPRWMTFKQAKDKGWQVTKGAQAAGIVFWQTTRKEKERDSDGREILDPNGKPLTKTVKLARPRLIQARVFNATQIKGIAPYSADSSSFGRVERAESILNQSGAKISHDQADSAFYNPSADEIHLPSRDAFKSEGLYYATALHELGHWTGHESRLDRQLTTDMSTAQYAREELRAEIYSYMMSAELGLPHDPGQHIAYIDSWIKALEEDPAEILRATRDAQKIQDYVYSLELQPKQSNEVEPLAMPSNQNEPSADKDARGYTEPESRPRQSPKSGGTNGQSIADRHTDAFSRADVPITEIQVREQFAQFLRNLGLDLPPGQGHPIMDGRKHRVPVRREDGKRNTAGMYIGYLDGWPAGHGTNHVSGEKQNWKANIQLNQSDVRNIAKQSAAAREAAAALAKQRRDHVARRVATYVSLLAPAPNSHPYLEKKGITADPELRINRRGDLILPLRNADGQIRTFQRIRPNSFKGLKKGGEKAGNYYLIGSPENGEGTVIIAEGYATGRTINELTQLPVVVAIDSNNLVAAAKSAQTAFPNANIVVAGDDDRHLKSPQVNAGRAKALMAANELGTQAIFPVFSTAKPGRDATDWNDLARIEGEESARDQLQVRLHEVRSSASNPRSNARTRSSGRGR